MTQIIRGGAELVGDITLAVTTTGIDVDPTRPVRIVAGDWSAKPFATIQAALDALPKVGTNEYTWPGKVIVNVGAGTFPGIFVTGFNYDVFIRGTRTTTTPATGPASGTADSGTGIALTLTGAGWTTNDLIGRFLNVTSGPGAGEAYPIMENTADTLTVPGNVGLAAGSVFTIEDIATFAAVPAPGTYAPVTVYACSGSIIVDNVASVDATLMGFSSTYCGSTTTFWHCLAKNKTGGGFSSNSSPSCWYQNCASLNNGEGFNWQGVGLAAAYISGAVNCVTGFSWYFGIGWAYFNTNYARSCTTGVSVFGTQECHGPGITLDGCGTAIVAEQTTMRIFSGAVIKNTTTRTLSMKMAQVILHGLSGSNNVGFGVSADGAGNVFSLVDVPTITGASGEVTVDGVSPILWTDLDAPGDYAVDEATGARIVKV